MKIIAEILSIDDEINDYFSKLELNILKYMNNKKGIKFITNKKNLMGLIYNEEFYHFIIELYKNLNIKYHNSYMQNDIFNNVDLNNVLIDEYKNTRLISQCGEIIFNELIVNSLNLNFFLTVINMEYADKLLSLLNLSNLLSANINCNNKKDVENRIKGILLNIKYQLIKSIKTNITDTLDSRDIQENIA